MSRKLAFFSSRSLFILGGTFALNLSLSSFAFGQTQPTAALRQDMPAEARQGIRLNRTDPTQTLHVSVSFPYTNPTGMQAFVDSVSNPKSSNYRKFISP